MEPVLVFLSTAVGTIVGVACAVLMMSRRNRLPAAEARVSPNLASAVAAATVTIEDVRKLLGERDQTLQQCREDLDKKQKMLDAATAAVENTKALHAEAEHRANELASQATALNEQMRELAARTNQGSLASEEAGRQVAALTSQLDSEKRQASELTEQIARLSSELSKYKAAGAESVTQLETELDSEKQQGHELTEQVAHLTSELTGYKVAGSEAVAQLEAQLEAEKQHRQELSDQVAVLTIDLGQSRQYGADADSYRSSLEAELGVGRLQIHQLTDQVADLTRQLDAQHDSEDKLTEQITRLSSDLNSYRVASSDAMAQIEEQLDQEKKQTRGLAGQVAALTADLTQARQYGADADAYRSSLEAELVTGRLKIQELTGQVAELSRDRSDFEVRLQEERQSAARGIELLALAQNTLSGAFQRLNEEKQRLEGATSRGPVRVAKAAEAEPDSPLVESPMAVLIPEAAETSLAVSA